MSNSKMEGVYLVKKILAAFLSAAFILVIFKKFEINEIQFAKITNYFLLFGILSFALGQIK
jgi:hypothetical protein